MLSLNFKDSKITLMFDYNKAHQDIKVISYDQYKTILILFLFLISISSFIFYYRQGLTLSYNDARSHLNVARRVVDSLQPGFAQIGSVWLPLYHIFELPFIWNNFLWHSGIAGSIVSIVSFVLGGVYLVKLCERLNFSKVASIVSLLIYTFNPNLLFMQTTPMTESLLIFLSIAVVYHLVGWAKDFNPLDLISAGFFTFLSTLTRYDGWFLLAFSALVVFIIAYRRKGYVFAEGNTMLFITLAGFGVLLWLVWNWAIFSDPLYFAFGPFSAKSQQDFIFSQGRLFSKGDLVYSFFIYILTAVYNSGLWLFIIFLIGIWQFLASRKISYDVKFASVILLVPFAFNVLSLVAGHSVIHLPGLPPHTWFNDRYGLMLLPAVAVFSGFLVKNRKFMAVLITLILFIESMNMYVNNEVITIEDGVKGASGEFLDEAGSWISENIHDGLILVAASSNDALLFKSGFELKRFITEGARKHWDTSMEDPTVYAKWVVMHKGDLVEQNLRSNENFLNNYKLVYKDAFSFIYKLNLHSDKVLTKDELPI
jgi:hypothetical protein